MSPTVGDRYNWKNQPERLVYMGRNGVWHQFAKVESPEEVWCEVLTSDLHMLEPTPQETLYPCDPRQLKFIIVIGGDSYTLRRQMTPGVKELATLIKPPSKTDPWAKGNGGKGKRRPLFRR